ncbi:MAG: TauD/TfdA family dioxygenase [Pseudomonadota bacterium]
MNVSISPFDAGCGAEVIGVDPRTSVEPDVVSAIDQALVEYGVLLIRERPLTAQQLTEFSRRFGPVQPHVQRAYQHPDVPEVVLMTNRRADGSFDEVGARRGAIENTRDGWHSDLSYDPVPAKATLLHAVEIPSHGGNTCFANVFRAYEALDPQLKSQLDGLSAEFTLGANMRNPKAAVAAGNLDTEGKKSAAVHPVINEHPVSGRPAIYANPLLCNRILNVPAEQSAALLNQVFDTIDRPEFRWEHHWRVGDTLMWDNRGGTMHCGRLDYPRNEARRFIRTTVTGGPTVGYRLG